jgi:hypothetical protein
LHERNVQINRDLIAATFSASGAGDSPTPWHKAIAVSAHEAALLAGAGPPDNGLGKPNPRCMHAAGGVVGLASVLVTGAVKEEAAISAP